VSALSEAGIPPGVLNIVAGRGVEVGKALLAHEKVRLVSFTGSTEVGRIVGQSCAATDKICSLEMGGKNVIMIMEDADLDLALEGVLWGAFGRPASVVPRRRALSFIAKSQRSSRACLPIEPNNCDWGQD